MNATTQSRRVDDDGSVARWSRRILCAAVLSAVAATTAHADQAETLIACSETPFPITLEYGQQTDPATDCTITPGSDIDRFRFLSDAGDEVRITLRSRCDGFDAKFELRDPLGTVVGSTSCAGNVAYYGTPISCTAVLDEKLTTAGEYQIAVADSGSDETGCYTLGVERLEPIANSVALGYGASVTDSLTPQTDVDRFEFEGVAGTRARLVLNSRTAGVDARIEVRDPNGVELSDSACAGNVAYYGTPVTCNTTAEAQLLSTGTYQVIVSDSGNDEQGNYELRLECVFGECPPARDVPCVENIQCVDENACTDDTCTAGVCTHPNNNLSCNDNYGCNGNDTCALGGCSAHQSSPCDDPDLTNTCSARCFESEVTCSGQSEPIELVPGQHVVDCAITQLADRDRYTFDGTKDERFEFVLRSLSGGFDARLEIRDPSGAVLFDNYCAGNVAYYGTPIACTRENELTLPASGTYDVAVSDAGTDENGVYELQLEVVPPRVPPLGLTYVEPVLSAVDPEADIDFYEFSVVANSQVRLIGASRQPGVDLRVRIFDSTGNVVSDSACAGNVAYYGTPILCNVQIDLTTIEQSENYFAEVSDSGHDESGGYDLNLQCLFGNCPFACTTDDECINDNVCQINHRCTDSVCRSDVKPGCAIVPDDVAAGLQFGRSVAIDEGTMVVGAPAHDLPESGFAYVFERNGDTFSQQFQDEPIALPLTDRDNPEGNLDFGTSVDIDGDTIVVGAPFDEVPGTGFTSIGSVSVFRRTGDVWNLEAKLSASANICSELGTSVAIDGDTIVAGGPGGDCALTFQRLGTSWSQSAVLLPSPLAVERFGESVGISGNEIAVGAPGLANPDAGTCAPGGSVQIFQRTGGTWTFATRIDVPGASQIDACFGAAVDIDGTTLVAGAPGDNGAALDAGAAFVYAGSGNSWQFKKTLAGTSPGLFQQRFGSSIDLDGTTLLVGAPGKAIYVFRDIASPAVSWRAAAPTQTVCKFTPTPAGGKGLFGYEVALDPLTAAAGAPALAGKGINSGAVFVTEPCPVEQCGNGTVEPGEDCDDGDDPFVFGGYCGPGCHRVGCGKPTNSAGDKPKASDALFVLRTAVGLSSCDRRVCDVNGDGSVKTSDALQVLRASVGQQLALTCSNVA